MEATTGHLNEYGESGLRTLALAYRKLDEQEYSAWNNEFQKAKVAVGSDREETLEQLSDVMERELILVGATAVEDKLQKGVGFIILYYQYVYVTVGPLQPISLYCPCQVPQCIDKLAQAGLKLWVLTGDKMETAINIGLGHRKLFNYIIQLHLCSEHAENGLYKQVQLTFYLCGADLLVVCFDRA